MNAPAGETVKDKRASARKNEAKRPLCNQGLVFFQVQFFEDVQHIIKVASSWVQKVRLFPFTLLISIGFIEGHQNIAIIGLKHVQPYISFPDAFCFFHFLSPPNFLPIPLEGESINF